jgi:hypothetical protein
MANYTIIRDSRGNSTRCTGGFCKNNCSVQEFYGFCETCWISLTPAQRAALKGTEVTQVEVRVTKDAFGSVVGFLWKLAITAAVLFLLKKAGYIDMGLIMPHW